MNTDAKNQIKDKHLKKPASKSANSKAPKSSHPPETVANDGTATKLVKPVSSNRGTASDKQMNTNCENSDSDGDDGANCCPHCLIQLNGKRKIKCDICSSSYHQKCTEIATKAFDKFIANVNEIGWVCSDCKHIARSSFREMEIAIAQLTKKLDVVKSEMNNVKY